MTNTKAMTIKYWNSLSEGSKKRALTSVWALQPNVVSILLNDNKPNPKKNPWWKLTFNKVRATSAESHYRTYVNGWFLL